MTLTRINRAMAELRYEWSTLRWPHPHLIADYAELHVSPLWLDLCWWNGHAWQYITTRKA